MTRVLFGLKGCDTTRAARGWLDRNAVDYRFHDVRLDGLTSETVLEWVAQLGWERVLNRVSTTWRQIPESEKQSVDHDKAVALLIAYPTLVKRPLLSVEGKFITGFQPAVYAAIFGLAP